MTAAASPHARRTALVVFTGEARLKWLRLLRPGFRHCFVIIRDHGYWVLCNPLSHQTEITVHLGLGVDEMAEVFRGQGHKVIKCLTRDAPLKQAPWRPYTCVEEVKRVLGIQDGLVLTPWRLYRHLQARCWNKIEIQACDQN